ncbi:MAG: hypothetical protein SFV54_10420 [Bryobacteraceae bacterium]|nr:hypothetical protein [Bryobacteraceae bacterium]
MKFPLLVVFAALGASAADVRVIAYDSAGGKRVGLGVFLDDAGRLATARSLLVGARRMEVIEDGASPRPVRWVINDEPALGVALVWVEGGSQTAGFGDELPSAPKAARDVPGCGVILELSQETKAELAGAPVLDARGRAAALLLPQFLGTRYVAFAIAMHRVRDLPSQPLLSIEEWSERHNTAAEEAYQAGLGQIWAEQYDRAVRNLAEAVRWQPTYPEAWFHLGFALGKLGRTKERVAAYDKAIGLRPHYAEAHYSLGISLLLMGRRAEAMGEVEALRKIPFAQELAGKLAALIEAAHVDDLKHEHLTKPKI